MFSGRIYLGFSPTRVAEAIAVVGESVALVGDSKRFEALCKELGCEWVELRGVAMPGFFDAHAHLDGIGFSDYAVDLRGCRSIAEMKDRIRRALPRFGGRWVYARGWDQELFAEGRWPTRADLDEVCGDRLCVAIRVCGHAGVVSSRVIEELRLVERFGSSPNLVRDESGNPTGVVLEEVLEFVRSELGRDIEEVRRWVEAGARRCLESGVTGVAWMSASVPAIASYAYALKRLANPPRVSIYADPSYLETLEPLGPLSIGSRARVVGVKLFVDGSLGARTALLSSPYSDDPSTSGRLVADPRELERLCRAARARGLDVAVHAIGDRAMDIAMSLVESYGARIEHASVVRDDQLSALSRLLPRISIQPHFVVTDWWVDRRLGDRVRWVYRFRELAEVARLGVSTDSPVEPLSPWETIFAAVEASPPGKRLGMEEALKLYTEGSASISRAERCGRLEPGYLADIIVLDRDPLEVEGEEIKRIRVLETYVGGELAYPR